MVDYFYYGALYKTALRRSLDWTMDWTGMESGKDYGLSFIPIQIVRGKIEKWRRQSRS